MVNTINTKTLNDGERNTVIQVNILGDGSGEEAATELVDVSGLSGAPSRVKIKKAQANLKGFSIQLEWNATANTNALSIPAEEQFRQDYTEVGGLQNDAGSGVNGDIDFTTVGLGAADEGTLVLWLQKS